MKRLFLLLPVLVFTGFYFCGGSGPTYQSLRAQLETPPDGQARLVLFRTQESKIYLARSAKIQIDGHSRGKLGYGNFLSVDIAAGRHQIKADIWDMPGSCEITLRAGRGKIYYLMIDPREASLVATFIGGIAGNAIEGAGKKCAGAFKIYPVPSRIARQKLTNLRRMD